MKQLTIILLLYLLAGSVAAQRSDSLGLLLPQRNPELRALDLDYRAALERVRQSGQWPDAELGAGLFVLPVETRLGPQHLRLGLTQMIPWPGLLAAQRDLAQARAAPLSSRVAARELTVLQQLRQQELQLYRLSERQEILRRNLRLYDAWENFALTRVESGTGSTIDVYRIQLRRQALAQEIERLEWEKVEPLALINQLLDRPPTAPVPIADTLTPPVLPPALPLAAAAIDSTHPALQAFRLEQEMSRRAIALNALESKVGIGVGIDYIFVGQRTDAEPPGNGRDILMPRVALRIPLNRDRYRSREQEEQLRIEVLESRRTATLRSFETAVATALARYERAASDLAFYAEQLRLLRATLQIAQTDYANGRRPFAELLELHMELIDYEEKELMTVVAMHQALIDLRAYLDF